MCASLVRRSVALFNWQLTACQWYAFIAGINGLNSINTLTMIAIDRYQVISKPLRSLYCATRRRSAVLIGVSWLWAALWSVPPLVGWGRYIGEGFQVKSACLSSFFPAANLWLYSRTRYNKVRRRSTSDPGSAACRPQSSVGLLKNLTPVIRAGKIYSLFKTHFYSPAACLWPKEFVEQWSSPSFSLE